MRLLQDPPQDIGWQGDKQGHHALLSCPTPSRSQETGLSTLDLSQRTGIYPASKSILHSLCRICSLQVYVLSRVSWESRTLLVPK